MSGERPLALDIGGSKTAFLPNGRPMCEASSEKIELIRPQEDCDGTLVVSEAELGSWKISKRRVDAIDNEDEPYLQYQDPIQDALRRVNVDCLRSRRKIVVLSDYAACG